MVLLNRNSLIPIALVFLLSGCAASSFTLLTQEEYVTEIKVTPDRVLLECEFQYKDSSGEAYGFMMHILDQENSVLSVVQTNVLDKGSRFRRIQKIGKILKTGKAIYVGGMGDLKDPKIKEDQTYTFPHLGTFAGNGRNVQFMVIANEQGLCYDAYSGDEPPCPREPFSLKNLK